MPELWLVEAAAGFWELAGGYTPDPDFEAAALFALPLGLEKVPGLTWQRACEWIKQRGLPLPEADKPTRRRLRACLITLEPNGAIVLLEASDPLPQQTFSLAHEVAHYMLDYSRPRAAAVQRVGPLALEVLRGLRQATPSERLEAILSGIPIKPLYHLMERGQKGDILSGRVLAAENRADRLALELLAPEDRALPAVLKVINGQNTLAGRQAAARQMLIDDFKLPLPVAALYAERLLRLAGTGYLTFSEWLK